MFCGDVAPYGIWREGRERQAANNDYTTMIAVVVCIVCIAIYADCYTIRYYCVHCDTSLYMWKSIRYVDVYVHRSVEIHSLCVCLCVLM